MHELILKTAGDYVAFDKCIRENIYTISDELRGTLDRLCFPDPITSFTMTVAQWNPKTARVTLEGDNIIKVEAFVE